METESILPWGRGKQLRTVWLLVLVLSCIAAAKVKTAPRPSNDECLACHGDSTLSKEVDGKPFSLYVNPDKFKQSIHGGMFTCVDCHTDVKTAMHETTA